jgi:hypothetical protein
MREIAVVTAPTTNYTDEGGAVTNPTEFHKVTGDLGTWHQIATLRTARTGCAAAEAASPGIPNRVYLGFFYGSTGTALLSSYEFLAIDISGNDQTVVFNSAAISVGTVAAQAPVARRDMDIAVLKPGVAAVLTGPSTWLLVMGGCTNEACTTGNSQMHFFNVTDTGNGTFVAFVPQVGGNVNFPNYQKGGYCALAGGGFVYDISGGIGATNDDKANEYEIIPAPNQVSSNAWNPSVALDASLGVNAGMRYFRCLPEGAWVIGGGGQNDDLTIRDQFFIGVL